VSGEKKTTVRALAIALGIICTVLIVSLAGAIANYTMIIDNKNTAYESYVSNHTHNDSSYNNLQNQNQQLQTWLDGNITYYNTQIESLESKMEIMNSTVSQFTSFPNVGLYMTYEQFFEWPGHNETTLMTWDVTGLQNNLVDLQITSYDVNVNSTDNSAIVSAANDNWTINLSNREIVNSTSNPEIIGFDCPFWIEKNVTLGSAIDTLYGQATITDSQALNVLGQQRDCWIVRYEWPTSSMVRWYDKATGIVLLIQVVRQEQAVSILSNETATETNIFQFS